AIWNAILYDLDLSYVNPPPTYTDRSQRIRTPSEILESRRGTCLDLTVLLCSCLEHVDIYPTIVLLNQHAFPAYWRSPRRHADFWGTGESALEEEVEPTDDKISPRGRMDDLYENFSWLLRPTGYDRIVRAIADGSLVPIESVWLTTRQSFAAAREAGGENL